MMMNRCNSLLVLNDLRRDYSSNWCVAPTAGLCDSSLRVQQSTITILGMLCTYPASVQSALSAIKSTPALLRFIGGIIDSPG